MSNSIKGTKFEFEFHEASDFRLSLLLLMPPSFFEGLLIFPFIFPKKETSLSLDVF